MVIVSVPAQIAAQEPAPTVADIRVEPFVATVGDRLALTIVVEHPPGAEITGPGEDADFGQAVFIESVDPVTEPAGDVERTTLAYTLTSFTVGQHDIPSLTIVWNSGGVSGNLSTPPAPYTIDTVLQSGTTTLRPLKPQLSIPEPAPPPFVPATFVALMAGLTVLGYWLVRRALDARPRPVTAGPALVPPRDPVVVARDALDALAASNLVVRDVPEYYARLAATLRQYLSVRFAVPAYAMTRTEIEQGMEAAGADRWPARLAANLLEQCEAAEFAKFVPARERRDQDLAAAYEIIRLAEPSSDGALGQRRRDSHGRWLDVRRSLRALRVLCGSKQHQKTLGKPARLACASSSSVIQAML